MGQVSNHVVTSREVQIAMVLEHILFQRKTPQGLYEVRPGQSELRNAVTSVLLEEVVALEAESFEM